MELQTLASCSSLAPSSAIAWASNSTPRCVFRRRSIGHCLRRLEFQQRFRPSRAVAAVFFASDGGGAAGRRRHGGIRKKADFRPGDRGGDVELEILKFMEQSGRPNVFPSKEELIAAGRGDLVEAAVKRGGWLTVGWEFGRKSSPSPDQEQKIERYVNGSGRKHDISTRIGSTESRANDEKHLVRLNGHASEKFPSKEILVDGSRPDDPQVDTPSPSPSYIRNGTGRRSFRKKISVLPQLDKITSGGPEVNAEASHERWRRKRRKKPAESSATVKDALSWIQDMVQKREQCILESRAKTSKDRNKATPSEISSAETHRSSSPLDGIESETSPRSTRSSSRLFPTETLGRDSARGKSLTAFSSRLSTSTSAPRRSSEENQAQTPASLTRTRSSSRLYSTMGTSALPKTSSTTPGLNSASVLDGSKSFNSRLRNLETKLLATRAALKSGRATLLKGEDKLMQVQRKTSEDLAKAADTLEFKENEILQTRAELRRTRAQVTALQAKMALELSEARKSADEKQVLLDRAESALKMLRFVRIVWPNAASHVLLTGSFDGWTNKIKMEKSGAGVFVTALHLYPGRYEVKFIVDGTWRVDPCRPITYADGIENNVLMVS